MLGLYAYGSSDDDDGTDTVAPRPTARATPSARKSASTKVASSLPPPTSSSSLFSELPAASGTTTRRVVTIPAPALARALEDDSESDSEDERLAKRARGGGGRDGAGTSLAAALPKPKRDTGAGGREMALDLGSRPTVSSGAIGRRDDEAEDEEDELSDEDAGPHAADMYAVGDDGQWVNQDAYGDVGDANANAPEDDIVELDVMGDAFVDKALAAAAKIERERNGREIKIATISAADLRKSARGPGAAIMPIEGQFSRIHTTQGSQAARHKHQLTELLHDAKVAEERTIESGVKAAHTRASNRQKYGW